MRDVGKVPYNFCWKVKLPLRIQIFIWLMLRKSILTRDALIHRGGKFEEDVFSDLPLFCGKDESIEHIFFACPLARYLWNIVSCVIGVLVST
jgi:hypothetical protein